MQDTRWKVGLGLGLALAMQAGPVTAVEGGESWPQFKYDGRHSGNVSDRKVATPMALAGAVPLTDAVFTAPVVADGRVYVVDGSGVVFCLDASTLETLWTVETRGGRSNCNNVASPALAGEYLHVGTTGGTYYVIRAADGTVHRELRWGDPILSAPVLGNGRVYVATLGSRVFALEPDGTVIWEWDFVKEHLGFTGDRWSGADWLAHKGDHVTWREQFCCSRNIALFENVLVIPAGGSVVWLEDAGAKPALRKTLSRPDPKRESPCTLGLSIGDDGTVYRQWHRRDNRGRVDTLKLAAGEVALDHVRGTTTRENLPGLMSFCSVSLRGRDVYRCRPEETFGLCKHAPGEEGAYLGGFPSIAPPILLEDSAVFGGLDGKLHVVPLSGEGEAWSFATPFGKAISAPVAVCDGRVYFGCEDGYLYGLGPAGSAFLPTRDLELWKIRSPLTSKLADPRYNRFTSFADSANTNGDDQQLAPPFKMKWIRRYKGTVKHFSTCGQGRLYTHTAEGQIFAVEQETGRLLWRRYFPGVHISFTSALYHDGRLFVPQAGIEKSLLRCLDAATGELLWATSFTGSPSWNRQMPPIVYKNLLIYPFSTGKYTAKNWLFEHQSTYGFSQDQKPLVRAWNVETGREVWTRDFAEFGAGGDDAGICLMDDTLYYSCYFGDSARRRGASDAASGVTASIEPATGHVGWTTTKYAVHAGCTVSGEAGRLYLGGYNPVEGKTNRVWCLDARDGSLVWQSGPVSRAIHVVTVGEKFVFAHSQYENGYLIDKATGRIISSTLTKGYNCTRFTLSGQYLIGPNMEVRDLSEGGRLVTTGPQVDVLECVGAFASNGRLFYTANGGGLQASLTYGPEAETFSTPWQQNQTAPSAK